MGGLGRSKFQIIDKEHTKDTNLFFSSSSLWIKMSDGIRNVIITISEFVHAYVCVVLLGGGVCVGVSVCRGQQRTLAVFLP